MGVTRDDERARRIGSLALRFMNSPTPLPSSDIQREFYPSLGTESFRRAFSRDREALASCGVFVEERRQPGEESSWAANDELSFASGAELSVSEAAALDVACQPLLDEREFPLADDLRLALAKLSRAFGEAYVMVPESQRPRDRHLSLVCSCLLARHALAMSYLDARGHESERVVAPYGLFGFRGNLYLVAGRLTGDGTPLPYPSETRTYRIDRIAKAKEMERVSFEIPGDFRLSDWRCLPFQMGHANLVASFLVPADREEEVRRASMGRGAFSRDEGPLVWTVEASSVKDAAAWAVAAGIRPLAPSELVTSWKEALEGAIAHVG